MLSVTRIKPSTLEQHIVTRTPHRSSLRQGGALVAALISTSVFAQAPASPQQPGRQLADTPPPRPGASGVEVPVAKPAFVATNIKVRPEAFRVTGSTVFTPEQLAARLSEFRGKELDFNGLADAAAAIKRLYVDEGYPLTDVYFPEQRFAAQGGTIEFAVVEARIGKAQVAVAPGVPVSASLIKSLVEWHLTPGQLITQAGLDRPVLLLRDMPGITATANVTPGSVIGQADVTVNVTAQGRATSFSAGLDNFGAEDVGRYRLSFNGSVDNLLGYGDTASASLQPTSRSGTLLYRLGYRAPIGPAGTKANLGFSHSKYKLGGDFAGLNALGDAKMLTLAAIHPLLRTRNNNVFLQAGADVKRLRDESGSGADLVAPERSVNVGKLGVLGSFAGGGLSVGATTSYSLTVSSGRLNIRDQATREADQLATGPGTQGSFRKVNLELQRVEYMSDTLTLLGSLAAQTASRNLTSAEKLSLTGPQAVRGYAAVSDTVVDEGAVVSLELRQRLAGFQPFGATTSVSIFYDYGQGTLNKVRNATTNSLFVGTTNRVKVDSFGIGASLGIEGDFFINATVSRRAGDPIFPGSDTNQFWFSAVKFF
jgi:hemolysin activation/secretion protein